MRWLVCCSGEQRATCALSFAAFCHPLLAQRAPKAVCLKRHSTIHATSVGQKRFPLDAQSSLMH